MTDYPINTNATRWLAYTPEQARQIGAALIALRIGYTMRYGRPLATLEQWCFDRTRV